MKKLLIAATFCLCCDGAVAQTPEVFVDLNKVLVPQGSGPAPERWRTWGGPETFAIFRGKAIFRAYTAATGAELFWSDGTVQGTGMIADILPGQASSMPRHFTAVADDSLCFFLASTPLEGEELWVTDGTAAGTHLVVDTVSGTNATPIHHLTPLGPNRVIFSCNDGKSGSEPWVSDGTAKGTGALADLVPGGAGSGSGDFLRTGRGDRVFFIATVPSYGRELWVTDGTTAGTRRVTDIQAGPSGSMIKALVALGSDQVLFEADDGKVGRELWVSDGTPTGTTLVLDLAPGTGPGVNLVDAVVLGGRVLFEGFDPLRGWEAWSTDGTKSGTVPLVDAAPGGADGKFYMPILDTAGNHAFFQAKVTLGGKDGYVLYRTDGTPGGTTAYSNGHLSSFLVNSIVEVGGDILFEGLDVGGSTGRELCVCHQTDGQVTLAVDMAPGQRNGKASNLTRLSPSYVLFGSDDGVHGSEPYTTFFGKAFLRLDINDPQPPPTADSRPAEGIDFHGMVLFSAEDALNGAELWISDGTSRGTRLVKDIEPGVGHSHPQGLALLGDSAVFFASTTQYGNEPWITDGTTAGTRMIKDIIPGSGGTNASQMWTCGTKVYFALDDGVHGLEPWVTDGTASGTTLLADIAVGTKGSAPWGFAGYEGKVVFRATDGTGNGFSGCEPWITDGTSAGTRLLKDIAAGKDSSNPLEFTAMGGRVYFAAVDEAHGDELWVTDFTEGGTRLCVDLRPGALDGQPRMLSAMGGRLLFIAYHATAGREPWVSDGTVPGTGLFHDLVPGSDWPRIDALGWVGSRYAWFRGQITSNTGVEPYYTDGTTLVLLDLYPGTMSGGGAFEVYRRPRIVEGGKVIFRGRDFSYGEELFSFSTQRGYVDSVGVPTGSTWLEGTDPVLGSVARVWGGSGLSNAVHVTLYGVQGKRPIRVFGRHWLHLDPLQPMPLFSVGTGPIFSQVLKLPNDFGLAGVRVHIQTFSFDAQSFLDSFEPSNGLEWQIGT